MAKKTTFRPASFFSNAFSFLRNLSIAKKKHSSPVSPNKAPVASPIKNRKKSPAFSGEGIGEMGIGA